MQRQRCGCSEFCHAVTIDYLPCSIFRASSRFGLPLLLLVDHKGRRRNLVNVCMPLAFINIIIPRRLVPRLHRQQSDTGSASITHDQQHVYELYITLLAIMILL